MGESFSRRRFAKGVLAGALSVSLGSRAAAQPRESSAEPQQNPKPPTDLEHLNGQIAMPVPAELEAGVTAGLKHNDDLHKSRRKHKLAEGSEPTSVYRAVKP